MKNEEKALEITKDYAPTMENLDAKIVLYDAVMEMAKWKEQQMIKKVSKWLNNFYSEERHCFLVKEDIEAFEKAMEE